MKKKTLDPLALESVKRERVEEGEQASPHLSPHYINKDELKSPVKLLKGAFTKTFYNRMGPTEIIRINLSEKRLTVTRDD